MKKYQFTDKEKTAIREAVEDLEKDSCGEVVPYFSRSSDNYDEVSWQMATILGAAGLLLVSVLSYTWKLPSVSVLEICAAVVCLMIIGFFLPVFFPVLKRLFVSKEKMLDRVNNAAKQTFLNEKVYETGEKVGILIYISRLEHLVVVLGDEGINSKVTHNDWKQVITLVTRGLSKRKVGQGLVEGIAYCKKLLLDRGFVRKDTDYNELDNDLRIKE